MTLENMDYARAVILASQVERQPIDVLAGHIFRDFASKENANGSTIEKTIEIWLTAFNMSRAAIVRQEWHKTQTSGTTSSMIGRILDRINLVSDGMPLDFLVSGVTASETLMRDVTADLENMKRMETPEPDRIGDLERRVEALEKRFVHPADRMAEKLPAQWISVYGLPMNKFGLILNRSDGVPNRVARDCEFENREAATSFGRDYAATHGYEFRDA